MTALARITHEFVDVVPDELAQNVLYVSIRFATAVHGCLCGCGHEVVTPLAPTDWRVTYDGDTVTLYPSIGNWSFPCRSHYWIVRDQVLWAGDWSSEEVEAGRARDALANATYYDDAPRLYSREDPLASEQLASGRVRRAWTRVRRRLARSA